MLKDMCMGITVYREFEISLRILSMSVGNYETMGTCIVAVNNFTTMF